jgi:hypothetical protein
MSDCARIVCADYDQLLQTVSSGRCEPIPIIHNKVRDQIAYCLTAPVIVRCLTEFGLPPRVCDMNATQSCAADPLPYRLLPD